MKVIIKTISLITLILSCFLAWLFISSSFATAKDNRIHIAVVDSGIRPGHEMWYCKDSPPVDFTGEGVYDETGHGTNIAGIIANHLSISTHCLMILKWYNSRSTYAAPSVAIEYAVLHHAKYINLSLYGEGQDAKEKYAIAQALSRSIKVIVAAGNDSTDLTLNCDAYPACYHFPNEKNFYVIADEEWTSNFNGPVDHYEDGKNVYAWGVTKSGSSQATAIFTGKLAKSEFPSRRY